MGSCNDRMVNQLQGKVAMITGATGGIGTAVCKKLALEGAHIVICYFRAEEKATLLQNELQQHSSKCIIIQIDVTNSTHVKNTIHKIIEVFNTIDILVNTAGVTCDRSVLKMSEEEWSQVLNTNLTGTFHCCKAVLPLMIKNTTGKIINISSVSSDIGTFGQANYAATKAGIIGFSKSLAREVARHSITVNVVSPGIIDSEMIQSIPEDIKKNIIKNVPLGRMGTPSEVADAITFLASDKAHYITGQTIRVNGGLYMG